LLNASFAFRKVEISERRRAASCIVALAPFVNWSIAVNIDVGELFWWLEIRVLINSDCKLASKGFCGVLETQGVSEADGGLGSVGVRMSQYVLLHIIRPKGLQCQTESDIAGAHVSMHITIPTYYTLWQHVL
jgi:hypothetical protein